MVESFAMPDYACDDCRKHGGFDGRRAESFARVDFVEIELPRYGEISSSERGIYDENERKTAFGKRGFGSEEFLLRCRGAGDDFLPGAFFRCRVRFYHVGYGVSDLLQ